MKISDFKDTMPICVGSYKDSYVSPHIAILLKEYGFDIPTQKMFTVYHNERVDEQDGTSGPFGWEEGEVEFDGHFFLNNSERDYSNENYTSYSLPTVSLAQRWLMEVKGVRIWAVPNPISSSGEDWVMNVVVMEDGEIVMEETNGGELGLSYDEALCVGLESALEYLIRR